MNSKIVGLLAVGLLSGPMAAGATGVAIPAEGGVTAVVATSLHTVETVDLHGDSFVDTPISLDQSAYALSGSLSGEYVEGSTQITADWTTPDQGAVAFYFEGSIQADCCGNAVYHGHNSSPGDDWYYTFDATTDGVFRLAYMLTGDGSGSGGYRVTINGVNVANFETPEDGTTLSDSQDFPLISGSTYTFALNNFAGFSTTASGSYVSSAGFTFEILAPEPADLLTDLIEEVIDLDVPAGIGNALHRKLQNALAALDRGNVGSAIAGLQAFINSVEAQRGKSLTDVQADALIAAAQAIIDALSPP